MSTTDLKVGAMLVCLALGTIAFAHGKEGVHLKGVVASLEEGRLTLTVEGRPVEVRLSPNVKIEAGGARGTVKDLTPGLRAVVHARKGLEGALTAELIRVAPRPKPTAP